MDDYKCSSCGRVEAHPAETCAVDKSSEIWTLWPKTWRRVGDRLAELLCATCDERRK